jgi:hypothetical protein
MALSVWGVGSEEPTIEKAGMAPEGNSTSPGSPSTNAACAGKVRHFGVATATLTSSMPRSCASVGLTWSPHRCRTVRQDFV